MLTKELVYQNQSAIVGHLSAGLDQVGKFTAESGKPAHSFFSEAVRRNKQIRAKLD